MIMMEKAYNSVLNKIDVNEVAELALTLGKIESPRGHETEAADYVFNWMRENGFSPFRQRVIGERFNVVGILKGQGEGQTLIFNSHLDTAFGLPEDKWIVGELEPIYYSAYRDETAVYGHGVVNDKGPMAAFLIAAKAIKESGLQLKGDLILTSVIGEIGSTQVDEFQDPTNLGKGLGTRHLVANGVIGDCALVAEATGFSLTWVEAGVIVYKITVKGVGAIYTPYINRPYKLEQNPNAIVKMTKVILALEEWALTYEKNNQYTFEAGTVVPKINIGAIRGGLANRPTVTPAVCSIYVDVRLPPNKNPTEVTIELKNLIKRTGISAEVQTILYRRGYEGKNIQSIVEAVRKAHSLILGKEVGKVSSPITSMWRDINVFNELGIPAVTYGPTSGSGGRNFFIANEDLYKASQVYALTALNICYEGSFR